MEVAVENKRNKIHPQKFALWAACVSITMMFAAWTSAYMVRQGAGNWLEFRLPNIFFVGASVLILSSVTLHLSYNNYKKGNERPYKLLLLTTFLLGITFIVLQYLGWQQLANIGVPLTKNPSGDFVYVLSGFHILHLIGGLATLIVAMVHAFSLKFIVTEKRRHRFDLVLSYWHYMGLLWIYLLTFFVSQS